MPRPRKLDLSAMDAVGGSSERFSWSFDAVVAGGLVLVNSGYPQHDQTPGNALFALRPRR